VNIIDFVQNEDGSTSFSFEANELETKTLVEFAIKTLIHANLIDVGQEMQDEFDFDFEDKHGGSTLQ
jgi:hypothetical protein